MFYNHGLKLICTAIFVFVCSEQVSIVNCMKEVPVVLPISMGTPLAIIRSLKIFEFMSS